MKIDNNVLSLHSGDTLGKAINELAKEIGPETLKEHGFTSTRAFLTQVCTDNGYTGVTDPRLGKLGALDVAGEEAAKFTLPDWVGISSYDSKDQPQAELERTTGSPVHAANLTTASAARFSDDPSAMSARILGTGDEEAISSQPGAGMSVQGTYKNPSVTEVSTGFIDHKPLFSNPANYTAVISGEKALSPDMFGNFEDYEKVQAAWDAITGQHTAVAGEPETHGIEFGHSGHQPIFSITNPENHPEGFQTWYHDNAVVVVHIMNPKADITEKYVDQALAKIDGLVERAIAEDQAALTELVAIYEELTQALSHERGYFVDEDGNNIVRKGEFKDWCAENLGEEHIALFKEVSKLSDLAAAGDEEAQARMAELDDVMFLPYDLLLPEDVLAIAMGEKTVHQALVDQGWGEDADALLASVHEGEGMHVEEYERNPDAYVDGRVESATDILERSQLALRRNSGYDPNKPISSYTSEELQAMGVDLTPDAKRLAEFKERGSAYEEILTSLETDDGLRTVDFFLLGSQLTAPENYVAMTQGMLSKKGIELSEDAIVLLRVINYDSYDNLFDHCDEMLLGEHEAQLASSIRSEMEVRQVAYRKAVPIYENDEVRRVAMESVGIDPEDPQYAALTDYQLQAVVAAMTPKAEEGEAVADAGVEGKDEKDG